MQNFTASTFALSIADEMISARFGKTYGIYSFDAYLGFVDRRATAHLDDHMAQRVRETAGLQRRKARLRIENSATVIIAVPMNDAHTGATVWAEIEFGIWLNLIEMGADGAWFYAHKGKDRRSGQVRTNAPVGSATTNKNVTVARLMVNAKAGQQARTLDRNPLNLRAANLYLIGNLETCEGRVGRAKTDSAALLHEHTTLRQSLAGQSYGFNCGEDQ